MPPDSQSISTDNSESPRTDLPGYSTPSLGLIFRVWFTLGIQSFGGGTATLALIQRAIVEKHRWITMEEFTRFWALCQIAPGINLFALTLLIGRKAGGALGVLVAVTGTRFVISCLLYTSPSPRDRSVSRMPSSA